MLVRFRFVIMNDFWGKCKIKMLGAFFAAPYSFVRVSQVCSFRHSCTLT